MVICIGVNQKAEQKPAVKLAISISFLDANTFASKESAISLTELYLRCFMVSFLSMSITLTTIH